MSKKDKANKFLDESAHGREYWPIDSLIPWKDNPRAIKGDDFKRLKKQIQDLGEYKPLIVNSGAHIPVKGEILGGNMRLKAYQQLGKTKCWVSPVHPKTEGEKLAYALSDNDSAGYYIDEELAELLFKYEDDFDIEDYKVSLEFPESLAKVMDKFGPDEDVGDDDEVPELSGKAESKFGEIYQLGEHRLMCGDALKIDQVESLLNYIKVDMALTDPPYNVGYEYNSYEDNKTNEEYESFCFKWFQILEKNSNFQVITPGTVNLAMWAKIKPWRSVAPWIKKNAMNNGEISHLRLWEPIIFYGMTKKRRPTDLFEHNISGEHVKHTCPKPLSLYMDIIKSFQPNTVLDVFGGSGTTLVACEKLGKTCFMMEIDPKYVDVIRKRYGKLMGEEKNWQSLSPKI